MAGEFARSAGVDWRPLVWSGLKPKSGVSAAARRARHALIADAAREAGAKVVLMAHTRDDLREAEVMRGQGSNVGFPRAWAPSPAWPEGRRLCLLRPMLGLGRAELRAWLGPHAQFIDDPANVDPRSARARARQALRTQPEAANEPERFDLASAVLANLARSVEAGACGALVIPQEVLGAPEAPRLLARALACASGSRRAPRADAVTRLLERALGGDVFAATLAGARVETSDATAALMIVRDAGEAGRRRMQPVPIRAGETVVFDGRFEIALQEAGQIALAAGRQAQLSRSDRKSLQAFAPAVRACQPVFIGEGGHGPRLAATAGEVSCLVAGRFRAACGLIAHEAEIAVTSRGEGSFRRLS